MDSLSVLGQVCSACGEWKTFGSYSPNRGKPLRQCKPCRNATTREQHRANPGPNRERNRLWRERNREYISRKNREYREQHAEELRAYIASWRAANPDLLRSIQQAYYQANAERRIEASRRYRLENREEVNRRRREQTVVNPEPRRLLAKRRKARLRGAKGQADLTARQWRALCASWGDRCLACGTGESPTVDHVLPIILGGRHVAENVQLLCRSCNSRKNTRTVDYRPPGWQDVLRALEA